MGTFLCAKHVKKNIDLSQEDDSSGGLGNHTWRPSNSGDPVEKLKPEGRFDS